MSGPHVWRVVTPKPGSRRIAHRILPVGQRLSHGGQWYIRACSKRGDGGVLRANLLRDYDLEKPGPHTPQCANCKRGLRGRR